MSWFDDENEPAVPNMAQKVSIRLDDPRVVVKKPTPEQEEKFKKRGTWERFIRSLGAGVLDNAGAIGNVLPSVLTGGALPLNTSDYIPEKYRPSSVAERTVEAHHLMPPTENKTQDYVQSVGRNIGRAALPVAGIENSAGRAAVEMLAGGAAAGIAGQASHDYADPNVIDPEHARAIGEIAGGVVGGGVAGKGVRKAQAGKLIREGAAHPDYDVLINSVVPELEGGGSIAHPKTSSKGASGPMQVMPGTSRDPGFGIKPSNGSAADNVRVGKQYMAAMLGKYKDPDLALAAYNWGPGHLDHALEKHGQDWFLHAPRETQHYVVNGMTKLIDRRPVGSTGGPVRPMSPEDMANAMGDTGMKNAITGQDNAPSGLNSFDEPALYDSYDDGGYDSNYDFEEPSVPNAKEAKVRDNPKADTPEPDNVTDLGKVRQSLENQKVRGVLDDKLDTAASYEDAIHNDEIQPHMTPQWASDNREIARKMHEMLPDDHAYKAKTAELLDIWTNIEHNIHDIHSVDNPTAEKPVVDNTGYEKFTKYPKKVDPANVNDDRFVGKLPKEGYAQAVKTDDGKIHIGTAKEGVKGYVGKDGTFLTESEAHKTADFQAFGLGIDNPRDPNPPAASSSYGTSRPLRKNYRANKPENELKAPDNHESPREVRSEKKRVLDKLGDILDQSTPIRREAEAAMMHERAKRLAQSYQARNGAEGREALYKALGALKGEMGRPRIHPIEDQFTPEEVKRLIDHVLNSPALQGYENLRAAKALDNLFKTGDIPTKSEVELLAKAMPAKASVWRRLLENEEGSLNLPDGELKNAVYNISGLPRTLKASFDVSAPMRQGMFLIGTPHWWKAMPGQFKALMSEGKFHEIQEEIRNRPTYDLMNKAGLQITRNDGNFDQREEAFISKFAESIPGVRHSERAYIAFLNKLRADYFDSFVARGEKLGIDFVQDPKYLKSAAKFINSATGRGELKGSVGQAGNLLGRILFSPKLMASRINLLNPVFYARLHPKVRIEAVKQGLIYASVVSSMLGMAAAAGAEVETDPRSTDFAKIKTGNTRFDVTGGFQPYVRFFTQMLTGQQKSTTNGEVKNIGPTLKFIRDTFPGEEQGKFKPTTRLDALYRFFENKESPNAGEATRLFRGTDPVGNPLIFNPKDTDEAMKSEYAQVFAPLIVSDTYQAYKDLGPAGLATAFPNAFGVGINTYTPKKEKPAKSDFGDFGDLGKDFGKDFK